MAKFKVGDRVKQPGGTTLGTIFKVSEPYFSSEIRCGVNWDSGHVTIYHESELELVKEEGA